MWKRIAKLGDKAYTSSNYWITYGKEKIEQSARRCRRRIKKSL
jgi:hypothetical protein